MVVLKPTNRLRRKERNDDHNLSRFQPEFQQISSVDIETGKLQEKRLRHREEAEKHYRAVAGQKVRMGMEASGHARWFERLLSELQFEVWIADAAEIRTQAGTEAKDGAPGCATDLASAGRRRFSSGIRAELGEIETCGNFCGAGTALCRRARAS